MAPELGKPIHHLPLIPKLTDKVAAANKINKLRYKTRDLANMRPAGQATPRLQRLAAVQLRIAQPALTASAPAAAAPPCHVPRMAAITIAC